MSASVPSKEICIGVAAALATAAAAFYVVPKVVCRTGQECHILEPIRKRRSQKLGDYSGDDVSVDVVWSMLNAAMWAPFHGKKVPWRFVILGKEGMAEMNTRTMNWYENVYDGDPEKKATIIEKMKKSAQKWTTKPSYVCPIIMKRAADPSKIMPEWEESAAVACAVQNMCLQATKYPDVGVYWSSWKEAWRDSDDCKTFLKIEKDDKMLGILVIGKLMDGRQPDRRKRVPASTIVEWRLDGGAEPSEDPYKTAREYLK
jgi:nitroreductase